MRLGLQATGIYFEGAKHAGVSRTSLRLLEAILERKEHQYVVFVRHDSFVPDHWLHMDHVKVVRAWSKTRSWHYLGRDIEPIKHRLDAWFSITGYVPRTPGFIKGSLVHDIFWRKYAETYTPEDIVIHEAMARNIARYSTYILANSEATAKDFAETYSLPLERFTILPLGIGQETTEVLSNDLPRPSSLPTTNDYLFTISTLEPRKNLPMLFAAFALLVKKPQYQHLDLVVAGAKGWKTEGIVERVAELGLDQRIHFLGFVPDAEVPALFQHAKVSVTASLEEGFGVPVLEAMTYGSVVAASNCPAVVEVGGDVPFYFDPTNEEAICRGLETALEANDREARIAAGRERARIFTWANAADILLTKIESLVKK